ncbi:CD48 antigen [Anabarilius grahami]|uniref:CD48 antigen n=1 Tax=Anabarilius grahami TaxID=495550 RepID=A0A3N0XL64_ANAGA|nr:CD48 antigen [Anabarilius grahami]
MSLRRLSLITIVVFITSETVSGEGVFKAVGDQVSFRPDKPLPPNVTSIIWKHINTDGITVKAIEWDEGEILIPNPRFKDITTVDEKTGQINITNLTVEHSGVYTIDINSKEQKQRFTLTVMKRVPKPVIEREKIKDNPDVVNLTCKYSETIIWKNSTGQILPGLALHPKGEFITVEKKGNPKTFYNCTLKNAVSEETSDPLYERDLFKGEGVLKAVGDRVSFRPDKFIPPVTSIIWKHINTAGFTVMAIEWDEGEILIPNPRFKDITTVDEKTGQITITNLKVEHSGVYTIDINSKEQQQRFTLTVMSEGVKKAVGDQVSFRPDNFVPPVTSIIWKHRNTDGILVKAIEWDEGEILIPNPRFKDITAVDEKTGQITITNLKVEHSGVYTIDIDSKEHEQRFNMTVMKRIPKPVIKTQKIKDNPDVVNLICEYSETIIWKNSTRETLTGSKHDPKGCDV